MVTKTTYNDEFIAASGSGIEGLERRLDIQIGYFKLRKKIKELPKTYEQIFNEMFLRENIKSERGIARVLRIPRWQVRRAKRFFKTFFR